MGFRKGDSFIMSAQPKVDDIAEIMDEIAALQRGMADAAPGAELPAEFSQPSPAVAAAVAVASAEPVAAPAPTVLDEFRAEKGTPPMDETAPKAAPVTTMAGLDDDQPKIETIPGGSAQEGALTMTLQGSMKLKLNYDFDGQTVAIWFSDGCLKVELANGTEFKIPVGERKRAA